MSRPSLTPLAPTRDILVPVAEAGRSLPDARGNGAAGRRGRWRETLRRWQAALPLAGLCAGLIARALGAPEFAIWAWTIPTLVMLASLMAEVVAGLRKGDVGLDLVALLSMGGAIALSQPLAGVVIALMYAGGQGLEAFAAGRAARKMTALLSRQPRKALREEDGGVHEIPIDAVAPGDRILVRVGDVVPVDGRVATGRAVLDQASLTGEALPAIHEAGNAVLSGAVNVGTPFTVLAERRAAESTYAGIVHLVEAARERKAPMARMADRYGLAFLAATLALAGGAWVATEDPLRALAVLVVATPCPLILAVPVALVSGLSRAAARGVLIKGGGALETLAKIRVLVIDKTGTLTHGAASLSASEAFPPFAEADVLQLAASLDQVSAHPTARTLVGEALDAGLLLTQPERAEEIPGEGVTGWVGGLRVIVGGPHLMRGMGLTFPDGERSVAVDGAAATVLVAVDGRPAGRLHLSDPLREDGAATLAALRTWGIGRIVLATGDRRPIAEALVAGVPVDAVAADLGPADKTAVVAAEAADVVLLVDSLASLPGAIRIARRAKSIALQSVWAGLGLSLTGMVAAALGDLTPLQGALLQEAIDVAVILNAMRVLVPEQASAEPRETPPQ